jgi:hypothetical protein
MREPAFQRIEDLSGPWIADGEIAIAEAPKAILQIWRVL